MSTQKQNFYSSKNCFCEGCKDIPARNEGCRPDWSNGEALVGSETHGLIKEGEKCPECGALYGNYHHLMCHYVECPRCHEQDDVCSCDNWRDTYDTKEQYEAFKAIRRAEWRAIVNAA